MMYMGSKNKIAKHLLPIMLAERKDNQYWVEPFVGGANMIDKVDGNRIGNDSHKYLIALLIALQNSWIPPEYVSKETYYEIKNNPESYPAELVGFVGFLCSFGGKWWGGYARNNIGTNYAKQCKNSCIKQSSKIKGVVFVCGDYHTMMIPENSLIYCDPPYNATTPYKEKFDHDEFWEWCRKKAKEGHTVFISEYNAPEDFECVYEIAYSTVLNKNKKIRKERETFPRYEEMTLPPLPMKATNGTVFFVSPEDYDKLKQHTWLIGNRRKNKAGMNYVDGWIKGVGKVSLARYILNAKRGQIVDHVDGDTMNNIRENLRIVTQSQNIMNSGKKSGTHSKYKGVNPSDNTFKSMITVNRKKKKKKKKIIYLGNFETETMAALCYDVFAKEYFGEYARLNFPEGVK